MSKNEPRDTQTKVKHEILAKYVPTWGFIISSGLRGVAQKQSSSGKSLHVKFVYVDGFAHTGQYAPESGTDEPTYGSPIIGIESLDQIKEFAAQRCGFTPEITSILIEERAGYYAELKETLQMKGYGSRVRETIDFFSLRSGEIALVRGDFHDYVDKLLKYTGQNFTWAFYLLDPYGAKGIPLRAVAPIISQARNDVMINFPYMDLHRKSRSAVDRSPEQELHNQYHDALYGSDQWRQIAEIYYGEASDERKQKMEGELVNEYQNVLQQHDSDIAIKTIRLQFPDMARTMFYLFLTTHDPTGAISLNEILDQARLREYELREEHRNVVKKRGQISMFEAIEDPGRPTAQDPDIDHVANLIYERCQQQTVEFREVLRRMTEEPYYHNDIKKAMTRLKRQRLAEYSELENREPVKFK